MASESTGTLIFFCGKMASGKTTLAKLIADTNSSTLISEDTLLAELYPRQITDVQSYVQFSNRLKSAIRPLLVSLLQSGASIVLDFPANTVKQRQWIKDIVIQAGVHYEFHYLDCSNAICKAQLKNRALTDPNRYATDTAEMFDAITCYFEPPSSDEGFEIVKHVKN